MKRVSIIFFFLFAAGVSSVPISAGTLDVSWTDRYGNIPWEDEKARLDNFAIQLMSDSNLAGHVIVNAGLVSCKGEAQARATRAKNYMVTVRGVPPDRILWRDMGYRESFEVSLWLVPAGKPLRFNPEFEAATAKHVITNCESDVVLRGVVVDWQDAVILHSTILVEGKNFRRELTNDENGEFKIELPIGTYRVSVSHPVFKTRVIKKFKVPGSEVPVLKVMLKVKTAVEGGGCPKGKICL